MFTLRGEPASTSPKHFPNDRGWRTQGKAAEVLQTSRILAADGHFRCQEAASHKNHHEFSVFRCALPSPRYPGAIGLGSGGEGEVHGQRATASLGAVEALEPDQRVLVTGARGFIGNHLVRRLTSGGYEVHAISRRGSTAADDAIWWQLDLHDPLATEQLIRSVRPDVVFHLASTVTGARDIDVVLPTMRNNLVSTVNLLTAAAVATPQPRVVLAGSMEEPRADDVLATPSSPYAAAKRACSAYAQMFQALWNLPTVVLRIAMVYGPGQRDLTKLVPHVITALQQAQAPKLTAGTREIDWIYIDDVVDSFLAAASSKRGVGHVIDVGSGTPVSIRETVHLLGELVGTDVQPAFGTLSPRQQDSPRISDPAAAKELLGWSARTELIDGLATTVRWYRDHLKGGTLVSCSDRENCCPRPRWPASSASSYAGGTVDGQPAGTGRLDLREGPADLG